jgi:hypothetical protein
MNTITKFDQKTLAVALKAITKSAVTTRDKVQEVAVYAVYVSITSGDVSVANALMDAIGGTKSLRKDSLVAYFERYGNFAWLKQDKKLGFFLNAKTGCTDGVVTPEYESVIVGAKWDEAKREAEIVSEYDMEKQFRTFIGRMEKFALDPANTVLNGEVLQAVRNTFNRLVAEKTLREIPAIEGADLKAAANEAKDAARAESSTMTDREALAVQIAGGVQLAA